MLPFVKFRLEFRVKKLYSNFEWALESFWAFFSSLILKDPWCPQVAAAHSSRSNHPSSGVIIQPYIHLHEQLFSPSFLLFQLFMFKLVTLKFCLVFLSLCFGCSYFPAIIFSSLPFNFILFGSICFLSNFVRCF